MQVIVVPCLRDNYAYLLVPEGSQEALVVDPSEAGPVLAALAENGLKLRGILNTHHHHDHVGGNAELVQKLGPLPVYAYVSDKGRIPEQTHFLEDGASFSLIGLTFRVLHIPGHTLGAIAYLGEGCAFTGDTLFMAGCGRLFEGTAEMMYRSMNERLAELPESTLIYCGHEYSAKNLEFAASVEVGNAAVQEAMLSVAALRQAGAPSVPSTWGRERLINPFLRCEAPGILAGMAGRLPDGHEPAQVFKALRLAKDGF